MAPHIPGGSRRMGGSGVGTREADNICRRGAYAPSSPHPVPMGKQSPGRVGRQVSHSTGSVKSCGLRDRPAPPCCRYQQRGTALFWLGAGRAPALTSWSSLLYSGAGYGEPGWAGGTWVRLGWGAGPAGRSFTLLAGTMPCWPCREQRHQPSSPPAPSLCSTRRTSPRRKDSSWGDSAVLS